MLVMMTTKFPEVSNAATETAVDAHNRAPFWAKPLALPQRKKE